MYISKLFQHVKFISATIWNHFLGFSENSDGKTRKSGANNTQKQTNANIKTEKINKDVKQHKNKSNAFKTYRNETTRNIQ